jgi:D-glycero-D-manno-heptose 1,7-bisphosphate phosphatase
MQSEGRPRPAMFLDRDGVIIEEVHYLTRIEQVRLIPGAAAAVRRLNQADVPVVVVTNQSGVAQGLFPEQRVAEVHAHLDQLLAPEEARVDRYYYCPHHPRMGVEPYCRECDCRKPRPGMLIAAARDLGLDLSASWLVGDKISDLEAATAAGCSSILVRTGHGQRMSAALDEKRGSPAAVVADLTEAVEFYFRCRK